ncbi:IclR family transcriptional regulator [Ereboglobus luteus]|uniref:Transcriptional regulator n=1 Tax=Ereboglobus luteus TaxID=1796921 RepID=A0A2U8E5X0_9BACT|nr:IclR family transcriptional regulator C-terminal domain-containing protein [Ereboglobus luteus]AWI09954.1 transcriptional regulator [Ereboglobus luteus]
MSQSPPRHERTATPLTQGIAVVRLLLQRGYALGVTQIANELGMPKSSLHRLLKTLCQIGFLQQNPRNYRYGVDARIFEFVHEVAAHFAHNMRLDAELRKTAAALDASVYVDMLGGRYAYVVCAAGDEGNTMRLGQNSLIHSSSPGKVLVAQMPESEWPKYAPREGDEATTPHTNLSPERFYAQLRQAREKGFAWNIRESSKDHVSIAAIVREPLVNPPRLAVALLLRHDVYIHRDQAELEQSVLKLAARLERILAMKR